MESLEWSRYFNIVSHLRTCIIPFLIMICYLTYWMSCDASQVVSYVRKEGYLRTSTSFHITTTATQTSCLIKCASFPFCKNLNVIKITRQSRPWFICQLFNCSISVTSATLVEAENATFYGLKANQIEGKDCKALKLAGYNSTGIYTVKPYENCTEVQVYCDMTASNGGWILLQKRFNGSVDFNRTWEEYKHGFGHLEGEFWLGLEKTYQFTKIGNFELRFDIWDGENHGYRVYHGATISDEADRYKLDWQGGSSGNTGDSMTEKSKGKSFSTKDKGNHCARTFVGAWWFGFCFHAHLNGVYGDDLRDHGLKWRSFSGRDKSLSKTEIKFKLNY